MGKKPAVKAKAKAAATKVEEPVEEVSAEQIEAKRLWQQRRDGGKWCDAKLDVVRKLGETTKDLAKAKGIGSYDWLSAAHDFHEIRLLKLAKRLKEKELDGVPPELKEGVEAYTAQFAQSADIPKDDLKEFRDVWDMVEEKPNLFVRAAESEDAIATIEQLKAWSDCSLVEFKKFIAILQANLSSPGVQEAGLMRIGWLCTEAQKEKTTTEGLQVSFVFPAIKKAMDDHLADPGVQRGGCAAMRGLVTVEGQFGLLCDAGGSELAVQALKAHFKDKEVAYAANGFFWTGGQKAGTNSAENTRMRLAGAIEALVKVMEYWAWDQTLCGRIRVTLPFLHAD